MEEKEYNLLIEPWIPVMTNDMEIKKYSLIDVLVHSHTIQMIASDSATQDVAIFRLLLSVIETIFYRYDENENNNLLSEDDFCDCNDVLARWKAYFDKGFFSRTLIEKYLCPYMERFYLFHPEKPFYQVANMKKKEGTVCKIACMNGRVKESNTPKTRHHFSLESDEKLTVMTYEEAARWLIFWMNWSASVKKSNNAPGRKTANGRGQLAQFGYIEIQQETLFKSIMMNLCPLKDGTEKLWGLPKPVWEYEPSVLQSNIIPIPDNIPEMYTIQSKRILLIRENDLIVGYITYSGDYYGSAVFNISEPMTLWLTKKNAKTKTVSVFPMCHSSKKSAWRNFSTIFIESNGEIPSLIKWYKLLLQKKYIDENSVLSIKTIGIEIDSHGYLYENEVNDSLSVVASIINEKSDVWRQLIKDEVDKCDTVAGYLSDFASQSMKIIKNTTTDNSNSGSKLSDTFFDNIDQRFRKWIFELDNSITDIETGRMQWEHYAYTTAKNTADEFIKKFNDQLFIIRPNRKTKENSISKLYKILMIQINKTFPKIKEVN